MSHQKIDLLFCVKVLQIFHHFHFSVASYYIYWFWVYKASRTATLQLYVLKHLAQLVKPKNLHKSGFNKKFKIAYCYLFV